MLEQSGEDLGIVTAITGLLGFRVKLLGAANHAGTTPMDGRRDALAGASRIVLELREEARVREDMTANVGIVSVEPGGFNVIPGLAEFTIDVRSPTAEGFERAEAFVRETVKRVAAEEGLGMEISATHRKPPVALDQGLQDALVEAAAGGRSFVPADAERSRARRHGPRAARSLPRCCSCRAAEASATRPTSTRRPSNASSGRACSPARCARSSPENHSNE